MNPTPEAVAAALALVESGNAENTHINAMNYRDARLAMTLFRNCDQESSTDAAARILAAEVRRLRLLCEAYADQAGMRMGYDRSKAEAEKMVSEKLNQPS